MARTKKATTPVCVWTEDADDGKWDSDCGESWCFIDGGPTENRVRFCHGCGARVKVKREAR